MSFGSQQIEYGYLGQAHTDGDIYVYFPGANILVAGDAMSVGKYPILDYTTGGWIGGLVDANKKLLSIGNAETRIMPGAGPMQTRADLQAHYDMLATMKDRLVKLMKQGMGPKDMIAAQPSKDFDEKPQTPQRAFLDHYCVTCHNQHTKTAGVMFDTMDPADVSKHGDIWEKAVRKLRGGMMPPPGARRPDQPAIESFVGWLENSL